MVDLKAFAHFKIVKSLYSNNLPLMWLRYIVVQFKDSPNVC